MRCLTRWFALAVLAMCCLCCSQRAAPVIPHSNALLVLDESVAFVYVDQKGHPDSAYTAASCGGVWVSPTSILTAAHCVDDAGKPTVPQEMFDIFDEMPPEMRTWVLQKTNPLKSWNPIGQTVWFVVPADLEVPYAQLLAHQGKVSAIDKKVDLALVYSAGLNHSMAQVSGDPGWPGTEVDLVGSPAGIPLTYQHGYLASARYEEGRPLLAWQVMTSTAWPGVSGGGLFDSHGALLGISDYIHTDDNERVSGMLFCIHRNVIREFLSGLH